MRKRKNIIIVLLAIVVLLAFLSFAINRRYQTFKLFDAIRCEDYTAAVKAINHGASVNDRNYWLYWPSFFELNPTPLIEACKKGNEDFVELLLENGADVNKKDNYNDNTPLLAALHGSKSNRYSLAFYLIENGADIYAKRSTTSPFWETLCVYKKDSEDTTREGFELFKYLIEHKVEMGVDWHTKNALTQAAGYRNPNAVRYLIENEFFDVDEKDRGEETALIAATKNQDKQTVELLLELGANKDIADSTGKTAYDYAVELGNEELIELLKD